MTCLFLVAPEKASTILPDSVWKDVGTGELATVVAIFRGTVYIRRELGWNGTGGSRLAEPTEVEFLKFWERC